MMKYLMNQATKMMMINSYLVFKSASHFIYHKCVMEIIKVCEVNIGLNHIGVRLISILNMTLQLMDHISKIKQLSALH